MKEINEIDQRYFKDQTKPAIDLVGTYGINGLAGSVSSAGVNPFTASNVQVRQRIDELSALAGLDPLPVVLNKAIADLQRATGNALRVNSIVVC